MLADSPEVTGGLSTDADEVDALRDWLSTSSTGEEYGRLFVVHLQSLAMLWGVLPAPFQSAIAAVQEPADELQRLALAMAAQKPFVVEERPEPIELTDELLEDVQRTTGLTYVQLANVFGISERAVAGWKRTGIPQRRQPLMKALRAIGLILVGGLGPHGVALWLQGGSPPRLQRLAAGELESVVAEAREYEFSPAT